MAENWNDNWLKDLSIRNFKSIKEVDLKCGRINVFIGEPNVGKSNILEAITLLSGEVGEEGEKFSRGGIRFEKTPQLFFEQKFKDLAISVLADNLLASIALENNKYQFYQSYLDKNTYKEETSNSEWVVGEEVANERPSLSQTSDHTSFYKVSDQPIFGIGKLGEIFSQNGGQRFKSSVFLYKFRAFSNNIQSKHLNLSSPFGDNLFSVIETFADLREEIGEFIRPFGYTFVMDPENEQLSLQKLDGMYAIVTPYSMIADTLQRMIFHFAAIYSNDNAVLLFEEPESHSFPPYITMLAERIVASETNQFFMTTHSPNILGTMMSYSNKEDVAIHYIYYEDGQTKATTLDDEKIEELLGYGVDVFLNLNWLRKG